MSSTIEDLSPRILVKHLLKPSIKAGEEREVNMASPEPEWAGQIIRFLRNGELPKNKEEARKVKTQASRYLFIGDTLYKRSFTLPLLRCLSKKEADYVFREIHKGICGTHSGGRVMAQKAIKVGYYWLSMPKMPLSLPLNVTNVKDLPTFLRYPWRNWFW